MGQLRQRQGGRALPAQRRRPSTQRMRRGPTTPARSGSRGRRDCRKRPRRQVESHDEGQEEREPGQMQNAVATGERPELSRAAGRSGCRHEGNVAKRCFPRRSLAFRRCEHLVTPWPWPRRRTSTMPSRVRLVCTATQASSSSTHRPVSKSNRCLYIGGRANRVLAGHSGSATHMLRGCELPVARSAARSRGTAGRRRASRRRPKR